MGFSVGGGQGSHRTRGLAPSIRWAETRPCRLKRERRLRRKGSCLGGRSKAGPAGCAVEQ
eukprot:9068441-Alexandrium_andersonii.AAC.1